MRSFVWLAVLGLGGLQCQAGEETTTLVIRGSKTLSPLVEIWASSYTSATPGVDLDIGVEGSEKGIRDLLMGQADIASSSRPMSPEEYAASHEKGLVVLETVVARMGIAVVTHPSNPVTSAPAKHIAGVFAGEIQNWQALGGPEETITVVRKESGWSPSFFQNRVMAGKPYLGTGLIVNSKKDIIKEVSQRPWAIGVTGMLEAMPALDRINLLRLECDSSVGNSTYALSRPLFFYSTGDSAAVQAFLKHVTSAEAQQSIIKTGFYPAVQADPLEEGE
jgi:phosphate transport system substrate-binding protein